MTIPKKYKDKNNRLRWSYIWTNNGEIRPHVLKLGFHPDENHPHDLFALLKHILPYSVAPQFNLEDFSEGGSLSVQLHEWFRESLNSAWQLWHVQGESMNKPLFLFENESDALHFKLRWG